jgi:hypothetical protein
MSCTSNCSPFVPVSPEIPESFTESTADFASQVYETASAPGMLPRLAAANVALSCLAMTTRIVRVLHPWIGALGAATALGHVALVAAILSPLLDQAEAAILRQGVR